MDHVVVTTVPYQIHHKPDGENEAEEAVKSPEETPVNEAAPGS
jgi:hypothetical protein